jgi:outer membrane protein assembly factor BamB
MRRLAALAVLTVSLSTALAADEWPMFRGSAAGVAADDPALPDSWSATENVAWKTPIPGLGWSSPVVWGDHVFLTTVVNTAQQELPKPGFYLGDWAAPKTPHRWMVYDIDFKTGKVRWEREVASTPPSQAKHLKNTYASETAVTDGERVFFYFGNLGLFAFDMNGKPLWSKTIGPFKTRNNWGTGASPVLHRDRLYIVNDNDEQSFLAGYDTRTGNEVWRVNRAEGTNWATPFVWENSVRTEIVTSGSDAARSYDLSGKLLWEVKGLSTISVTTPFASHGMLMLNSGYVGDPNRPAFAIKPGASGDISLKGDETSNAHIAWALKTGAPYQPTPIVVGDIYYTVMDRGFFTAHDVRTGKEIYPRQRISTDPAAFVASPWSYGGKIFAMSEDGDTYVIQAGPEFKVLGKHSLGEMALASPAVAHGSVVIRTLSHLYRITKSASR